MLKLEDAGHYMALKKQIEGKLKGKALQVLKQKWLLAKMSISLFKQHEVGLQRKVFTTLRLNMLNRVNLRLTVAQ